MRKAADNLVTPFPVNGAAFRPLSERALCQVSTNTTPAANCCFLRRRCLCSEFCTQCYFLLSMGQFSLHILSSVTYPSSAPRCRLLLPPIAVVSNLDSTTWLRPRLTFQASSGSSFTITWTTISFAMRCFSPAASMRTSPGLRKLRIFSLSVTC